MLSCSFVSFVFIAHTHMMSYFHSSKQMKITETSPSQPSPRLPVELSRCLPLEWLCCL
jgi:hypothetical protein